MCEPARTSWPSSVPGTRFTDVRHLADVDSTNRYALDEAALGAPEGLVVTADHQRAGRGRLGRRWEAPAGANLLVSVLLRPNLPWEAVHCCAVATALAAADACREVAGVAPAGKWPNDLVVGDRKLAGILSETTGGAAGGPDAVVVGLGLNVGWHPPDPSGMSGVSGVSDVSGVSGVSDAPPGPATSLEREAGRPVDRARLLMALLRNLERRLVGLDDAQARAALTASYAATCASLGRRVVVVLPSGRLEGTAVDLTEGGALVLDVGGTRRTVTVGDVVHLRPGTSGPMMR